MFQCKKDTAELDTKLGIEIDSTKLGQSISEYNLKIEFNPPINWEVMKSEMSSKNESLINKRKAKERFIYTPQLIFFNESKRCFLSIGRIKDSNVNSNRDSLLNNFSQMMVSKFQSEKFLSEEFVNNGINIRKFIIHMPQIVSYKIVFENSESELIQFEYTIPNEFLSKEKLSVSSSISTIKLLPF